MEQRFSSRIGFILSALGIAVGTGNVWRFPRIVAQASGDEGAGAFLFAWAIFLIVWSVPLILAEYALGRKGRIGLVSTFTRFAGKGFSWMGAFVGFVVVGIMSYYSVVTGWCLYYLIKTGTGTLDILSARGIWDSFQSSNMPIFFHALAMGLGSLAVWRGVESIEQVNKILVPILLGVLLLGLAGTLTLEGAWQGICFLFTPDWRTLAKSQVWLEALTQNAFDTGAGWGMMLTYGAYLQRRYGVVKNAVITAAGNNAVSILAAMVIFGTVFAIMGPDEGNAGIMEVMKTSGPAATGLTFIWIPQLFANFPAGNLLAVLFFLGLSCAAFSSLISMIELFVKVIVDLGVLRRNAITVVFMMGFLLGIPSASHLGFFQNQDFVWSLALIISGAFIAFVVIRFGAKRFRADAIDGLPGDWKAGRLWDILITYIVPLLAVLLIAWWLYLSMTLYAPDTWYNPFESFSVMTCLMQWGLVMVTCIILNRWLSQSTVISQPKQNN